MLGVTGNIRTDDKGKTREWFWKVLVIIGFVTLFMVIFPTKINERGPTAHITARTEQKRKGLANFLNDLRAEGYRIHNYYPSYIQVEKSIVPGSPELRAKNLAYRLWLATGTSVKIILVTSEGRYVGFYRPEP